ncbi:helix-turn-helix domain-containing protein [Sphingopyxis sp. P1IMeth2]|uniref:AlbA family DNA-binding domain-containing protein n=1 Tax=Sphingopyxis sp. P1IMeth2 TaxID=1892848 RepID=UPI0016484C28|nr:ATP-binding protein [Sphingopyxis sp. P1IMeth2]
MSDYSPFDKAFTAIEAADLAALHSAVEGWYVEYKAEVPNAAAIAKSISAFANTYGGWLFYGISERSKEEAVAGAFPGILRADVDGMLQRIRQAAAQSINPTPHFDVRAIWGPDKSIGLKKDHAVIIVHVPQGHAAPFVHKTGVIYRRVGDGSEPKAETDRFVLDQLWKRSTDLRKQFKRWLGKELELSKGERNQPYLRLFIIPDLWRDRNIWAELTTARVREIMMGGTDVEETYINAPFETVHRTASGYVCRQLAGNNPHNLSATWFLNPNLVSQVVLPLFTLHDAPISALAHRLSGYDHASRFANILTKYGHVEPTIVDLNFVFSSLMGAMHTQSLLNREAGHSGSFFIKAQLINVWRTRPFVDVASVMDHQEEHGVPVCMNGEFYAPPGTDPDDFTEIPPLEEIEGLAFRKFQQAMIAFEPIAQGFGIETFIDLLGEDGVKSIHPDLITASSRATEAQRLRTR